MQQRWTVPVMKGKAFQWGVVLKGDLGMQVWQTVELAQQHF